MHIFTLKDFEKIKEKGTGIAYTHSGIFHADDVFAAALLQKIADFEIHRVSELPVDIPEDSVVFDIGKGQFDHHQDKKEYRDNGIEYASFGKLWRVVWPLVVSTKKEYYTIDQEICQCIDGSDTGTGEGDYMITNTIKAFNPPWYNNSIEEEEKGFLEAIKFATIIIDKHISRIINDDKADVIVQTALMGAELTSNPDIVILDQYAPWKSILIPSKAKFVIYPSIRGDGEYNVQTVPERWNSNYRKCLFPYKWANATPQQLNSMVKGLKFCHQNRSLISTDSLSSAVNACKYTKAKTKK